MLHHAKTRTYLTRRRAEQKNLAAASTLAVLAEGTTSIRKMGHKSWPTISRHSRSS